MMIIKIPFCRLNYWLNSLDNKNSTKVSKILSQRIRFQTQVGYQFNLHPPFIDTEINDLTHPPSEKKYNINI